jgi:hypothetical protein
MKLTWLLLAVSRSLAGRPRPPGWRLACGYVTGELALIIGGGQAGASRPPRDSRAASCHGDKVATSGQRAGICRCSAASTPSAPAAGPPIEERFESAKDGNQRDHGKSDIGSGWNGLNSQHDRGGSR